MQFQFDDALTTTTTIYTGTNGDQSRSSFAHRNTSRKNPPGKEIAKLLEIGLIFAIIVIRRDELKQDTTTKNVITTQR